MSVSSRLAPKIGVVHPLKLLSNLEMSSSPVACPQPSWPPSHNPAAKSHPMAQLPVCLSYPLHPGHNTQWPGVSEATRCPHLKPSQSFLTPVSLCPHWPRPQGSPALLPCFRLSPRHVLCLLEAMRVSECVRCLQNLPGP